MTSTTAFDSLRQPLPAEIIRRTRTSLAEVYAAARQAEIVISALHNLPQVQAAIERNLRARSSRPAAPTVTAAAAIDALLSLPPQRQHALLASLRPWQQKVTLKRTAAAACACARTQPQRAQQLADFILRSVRSDRLPVQAPVLRRQLAGRALLARARALLTLNAHAAALPIIAEAHAAFPHTIAYERDRIHAQLLRGQALAAAGDATAALQTLAVCARRAIEHIDPPAVVDALASLGVVLCAHAEYDIARPALALAAHIAQQPGNESSLATLHTGLAECSFLGYTAAPVPPASA
jgi:tetratricopeptide (TPR) repeat protein